MVEEQKVKVYAPIDVQEHVEQAAQEKAAVLAFPEEKQGDLQYIRSILVSAGTNKNGAHFLPSELMKAHNTIVHKAIDTEHEEEKVVGHIYDCAFLYKDGTTFDPKKLLAEYVESAQDPDMLDIDIAAAGVLHKMRFPNLAEEVSEGLWKVSMECYFKDFDIKIGNQIITRNEAKALGYNPDELIGGFVKVVTGTKALGKYMASRVLRDITFSGMGLVKNPANPHSIIMETAARRELMERGEQVVDLERIDNLRGHQVNVSSSQEKASTEEVVEEITVISAEEEVLNKDPMYVEIDKETGGVKRVLTMVDSKEEAALRNSGPGIGPPGSVDSYPDEICKSFKKRVTKFNALDQSEGQVVHEHWCALFEEPCPVIGATAKAPECLRNQRRSVTKNPEDTNLTTTIREHLDHAPSNTYVTVLSPEFVPTSPNHSEVQDDRVTAIEREEQVARIRADAEALRNSLRSYVTAEKKTSE